MRQRHVRDFDMCMHQCTWMRVLRVCHVQVVYSWLLGMIFLSEGVTALGAAGALLIAVGVVVVNLRVKKHAAASKTAAAAAAAAAANAKSATSCEACPGDEYDKDKAAAAAARVAHALEAGDNNALEVQALLEGKRGSSEVYADGRRAPAHDILMVVVRSGRFAGGAVDESPWPRAPDSP